MDQQAKGIPPVCAVGSIGLGLAAASPHSLHISHPNEMELKGAIVFKMPLKKWALFGEADLLLSLPEM